MKKSLIAKIVGLGASALTLILMLMVKISVKVTFSAAGQSISKKTKFKFMEVVTNKDDMFDDIFFRTLVLFAFILVVVALIYFAVSVVLEVLGKKLPVAQADLIGGAVIVLVAVLLVLAQLFADKEKAMGMTQKISIQTLSCIVTYVALLGGAGTIAAKVVLKD
jgi:hypothetical protein